MTKETRIWNCQCCIDLDEAVPKVSFGNYNVVRGVGRKNFCNYIIMKVGDGLKSVSSVCVCVFEEANIENKRNGTTAIEVH